MGKFKELLRRHEYGPLPQERHGVEGVSEPRTAPFPAEKRHEREYASRIGPRVHEEYLKIKTIILASSVCERPVQSLMVIGSVAGEGATTLAVTLGHVMAAGDAYPTLLVDSDIRRPSVHRYLRIPNDIGLGELLTTEMPFEQAIQSGPLPDLSVITAGNVLLDTSSVLKTNRFQDFMAYAKKRFRYIIFDAPPVSEGFDGIVFGAALDGCILVVQADETPVNVVSGAQQRLVQARLNVLGVVLNRKKRYVPNFILNDYGTPKA
jgi:capsular exopolysaccharide synthesis family protein